MKKDIYVLAFTDTKQGFETEDVKVFQTNGEARLSMLNDISNHIKELPKLDEDGCGENDEVWIDYNCAATKNDNKIYWDLFHCEIDFPEEETKPKTENGYYFNRCLQNAMELGKYLDLMTEKSGLSRDKCARIIQEWSIDAEANWDLEYKEVCEYSEFIRNFGEMKYNEFISKPKHKIVQIQLDVRVDGYLDDEEAIETALEDVRCYPHEYIEEDNVVGVREDNF